MKSDSKDTYSYKGWLISDNFWKRCFAVFGYYSLASLILSTLVIAIVMFFFIMGYLLFQLASIA